MTTTAENRTRSPVTPDPNSPIVLLGDSHNLVFHEGDDMHARGAGLPDQLALELGLPLDVVAVRNSGVTPARVTPAPCPRRPDILEPEALGHLVFCS